MRPPFFEDLAVGARFEEAPALTLTDGHAALHQSIAGDRLRIALDREVGERVLGPGPPLAHPALVWDVAIGQSTVATGRVIANLFYRAPVLRRRAGRRARARPAPAPPPPPGPRAFSPAGRPARARRPWPSCGSAR